MIRVYMMLLDLLSPAERRRAYLLFVLIVASGFTDMLGVASVLPFLAVLADPGSIEGYALLSWAYSGLGFQTHRSFLIFLGFAVLGVIVFGIAFKMVTLLASSRFSQMRSFTISMRLLEAYLNQPYVFFLTKHSSDMTKNVLSEVDRVVNEGLLPAIRILSQVISLCFLLVLLVVVNPIVALFVAVVLIALYVAIFLTVQSLLTRLGQQRMEANRMRYKITHDAFHGIKDVKLMGLENILLRRFRVPARELVDSSTTSTVVGEAPRFLLEAIAFGGMILLVLGLLMQGDAELKVILPTLGVFAFAGLRMFPALQQIYSSLTRIRYVAPMLQNVHHDVVRTRTQNIVTSIEKTAAPQLSSHLDLIDVCYRYPGAERPTLVGFNLTIRANTTVGIVGGTGAGKTTAVDLILGLLRPETGAISVDGVEITESNLRAWQDRLGYVPQQINLVDDTIAANIAFGVEPEKRDMEAVIRAARIAELDEFVLSELPNGYETMVGERGVRLSGGQRQRIGIARGLYHDPDVLILDEATSALDNLTERAVMESVHKLSRKKTIIMIAHRLTTVRNCDTIFLLQKGKLLTQGRYDELIARSEAFRRMALVDEGTAA